MADSAGNASRPRLSVAATIRGVLLSPRAWFSSLPEEGAGRAVWIALFVRAIADPIAELGTGLVETVTLEQVLTAIATGPLSALIGIYVSAVIVHALAWAYPGARRVSFGKLVACFAYAQLSAVLGVVPVVGPTAAALYWLWLCALGIRCALGRSWLFASLATLGAPGLVVVITLLVHTAFTEAFKIPASSMAPSLMAGDHIFIRKTAYGWLEHRVPARGDVIVFRSPEDPRRNFVKRVIGLPGDRISVTDGSVHVNGLKLPTCVAGRIDVWGGESRQKGVLVVEFLDRRAYLVFHDPSAIAKKGQGDTQGPYVVAPGEVFVLGDNRENSYDSRSWFERRGGGVRVDRIKGRANVIWMAYEPLGGIAWSRLGSSLDETPRCQKGFPPETCDGLVRCLDAWPPQQATTPPQAAP